MVFSLPIVTGILLQVRIELDSIVHNEQGCLSSIRRFFCSNGNQPASGSPYHLNILRLVLGLGLGIGLLTALAALGKPGDFKNVFVANFVIAYGICPAVFVYNHDELRALAWNKLKHTVAVVP